MRRIPITILLSLTLAAQVVVGRIATAQNVPQGPAGSPTQDRVIGDVKNIDLPNNKLVVRADAGNMVTILFNEKTVCLATMPGESNLDRAQKKSVTEIQMGDRVYARGSLSDDKKSINARQLVMIPKAEIARKQEREREEWVRRGISGVVVSVNPQSKEFTVQTRGPEGDKPITITAGESSHFRRYAPGSVKFADAKASSLGELKVGDQVRALGERSHDSKRLVAEEIVSGAFRTVGGTVAEVNPQKREVKIILLNTKQELIVGIARDTMIRRITGQLATAIAQGGAPNSPEHGDAKKPAPPIDLQSLLEKVPPMPPQEIRPGDVVIVSATQGNDPSRVTAIAYLTGLDVLLTVLQGKKAPRDAGPRNMDTGLPVGVLEFGIGLP
jgi:hypothetical protein